MDYNVFLLTLQIQIQPLLRFDLNNYKLGIFGANYGLWHKKHFFILNRTF